MNADKILEELTNHLVNQANLYKSKLDTDCEEVFFIQQNGFDARSKRLKHELLIANLNNRSFKAYQDVIEKLNQLVSKED